MKVSDAISTGLTPRELEHYMRHKVSPEIIATTHGVSVADVHSLAVRWGLDHLGGRVKSTVTINRK